MLGKDVEDEGRTIDDLDLDNVLERAALRRGKLPVADHGVSTKVGHDLGEFLRLARAEEGGGVGVGTALHDAVENA